MKRFYQRLSLLAIFLLLVCPLSTVQAGIDYGGDINPGNPNLWTSSTTGYIGQSVDGHISVDSGSDLHSDIGHIGYDAGTFAVVTLSNSGSTWTTNNLIVGDSGIGNLFIQTGADVTSSIDNYLSYSTIGNNNGSDGLVIVDGNGSNWNVNYTLTVGNAGTGTLHILNGGTVHSATHLLSATAIGIEANSLGNVIVDGYGSSWINDYGFHVGYHGHGILDITDRATITLNSIASIGSETGSTGIATVDGIDSTWTSNARLFIGDKGNGTFNVLNGATASSEQQVFAGEYAGVLGIMLVDGPGSTWTNTYFHVGKHGDATLDITNGGVVNTTHKINAINHGGYLGRHSGSTGIVTVEGDNSAWNIRTTLVVGYEGQGTLNITDEGTVTSVSATIANTDGSLGDATVDGLGSTWTNSGNLHVGYDGNATLSIINGGLVSVGGTLLIDADADGNAFVNMSTDGKLALYGNADDSLTSFLGLINGTDAIQWWNDSINDWDSLTNATMDVDYTLDYQTTGDLTGHTLLTVHTVPEPSTIILLATLFAATLAPMLRKRIQSHCQH